MASVFSTPAGDTYTFAEYRTMLERTGLGAASLHPLPPSPAAVVVAAR